MVSSIGFMLPICDALCRFHTVFRLWYYLPDVFIQWIIWPRSAKDWCHRICQVSFTGVFFFCSLHEVNNTYFYIIFQFFPIHPTRLLPSLACCKVCSSSHVIHYTSTTHPRMFCFLCVDCDYNIAKVNSLFQTRASH